MMSPVILILIVAAFLVPIISLSVEYKRSSPLKTLNSTTSTNTTIASKCKQALSLLQIRIGTSLPLNQDEKSVLFISADRFEVIEATSEDSLIEMGSLCTCQKTDQNGEVKQILINLSCFTAFLKPTYKKLGTLDGMKRETTKLFSFDRRSNNRSFWSDLQYRYMSQIQIELPIEYHMDSYNVNKQVCLRPNLKHVDEKEAFEKERSLLDRNREPFCAEIPGTIAAQKNTSYRPEDPQCNSTLTHTGEEIVYFEGDGDYYVDSYIYTSTCFLKVETGKHFPRDMEIDIFRLNRKLDCLPVYQTFLVNDISSNENGRTRLTITSRQNVENPAIVSNKIWCHYLQSEQLLTISDEFKIKSPCELVVTRPYLDSIVLAVHSDQSEYISVVSEKAFELPIRSPKVTSSSFRTINDFNLTEIELTSKGMRNSSEQPTSNDGNKSTKSIQSITIGILMDKNQTHSFNVKVFVPYVPGVVIVIWVVIGFVIIAFISISLCLKLKQNNPNQVPSGGNQDAAQEHDYELVNVQGSQRSMYYKLSRFLNHRPFLRVPIGGNRNYEDIPNLAQNDQQERRGANFHIYSNTDSVTS